MQAAVQEPELLAFSQSCLAQLNSPGLIYLQMGIITWITETAFIGEP